MCKVTKLYIAQRRHGDLRSIGMDEGIYSTHGMYTTEEDTVVLSAREGHGNLHYMGKKHEVFTPHRKDMGSTQLGEQIRGLHYMGRTASFPVPGSPGASDFLKLLFRAELISTSPWRSPRQARDSIFVHMAKHRKCSSVGSAASQLPAPPLQEGSEWGGQEAPPQLENGCRGARSPRKRLHCRHGFFMACHRQGGRGGNEDLQNDLWGSCGPHRMHWKVEVAKA